MFEEWFESICQKVASDHGPAVIYMDGASSHRRAKDVNVLPTSTWTAARLQDWLEGHGYSQFTTDEKGRPVLKALLQDMCKEIIRAAGVQKDYVCYEIVKEYGHTVAITPPYHPELQPIERVWCCVKNQIAEYPVANMTELRERLKVNFNTLVTEEILISSLRQSQQWEDLYFATMDAGDPAFTLGAGLDLAVDPDDDEEDEEEEESNGSDCGSCDEEAGGL